MQFLQARLHGGADALCIGRARGKTIDFGEYECWYSIGTGLRGQGNPSFGYSYKTG